jgi:hypothetical protein
MTCSACYADTYSKHLSDKGSQSRRVVRRGHFCGNLRPQPASKELASQALAGLCQTIIRCALRYGGPDERRSCEM